jgi:hypothetical protein
LEYPETTKEKGKKSFNITLFNLVIEKIELKVKSNGLENQKEFSLKLLKEKKVKVFDINLKRVLIHNNNLDKLKLKLPGA